jgi:hypothetical protein
MRVYFSDLTLPYLPLQLSYRGQSLQASGMMDTGSMVNVLPYPLGAELGLRWEDFNIELELTGNLQNVESRAVLLEATVGDFPIVLLSFAWAKAPNVPLILGHINFLKAFEVCFYSADSYFEVNPKQS